MNKNNDKPGSFDSLKCSLKGVNIIEASAGTGKTYTIENLYARLVLLQGYTVDSILVVTYTEAATKELISRIRSLLYQIKQYHSGAEPSDRIKDIVRLYSPEDRIKKERITAAVENFDNASIFTIHGFCKQMLNDYAFESGILFNVDLETNLGLLIDDIVEDFWRLKFYNCDYVYNTLAVYNRITPESLSWFIQKFSSAPNTEVTPQKPNEQDIAALPESFKNLSSTWERDPIVQLLAVSKLTTKKGFYGADDLAEHCDNIEKLIKGDINEAALDSLEKFSKRYLHNEAQLKKSTKPEHPFFDEAERLYDLIKKYKTYIRYECIEYFIKEYKRRKELYNIQTFDGLLEDVYTEISKVDSPLLKQIKLKFKAALIDEFQDTDFIQYKIFSRIFMDDDETVFVVGDPKQAIYSFRGGDIYTYQEAKKAHSSKGINSLSKNYRSSGLMVRAVNSLFDPFQYEGNPFVNKDIEYFDVTCNEANNKLLVDGQEDNQPLKFILIDGEHSAASFMGECCKRTALEIYELLISNTAIKSEGESPRKIKPSDITVLVNSHRQAAALKPELSKLNIPAVLQATGSVFDTREAEELELIIRSIAEPGNMKNIRGALLTEIIGYHPEDISCVDSTPENSKAEELENIFSRFKEFSKLWIEKSFIEMFNSFMSFFKTGARMLKLENGERKLTNILHLVEILHNRETSTKSGINTLLLWFSSQRDSETRKDSDEHEIRLETDSNAVNIMTVHKSKGLEFSIVFCPFIWSLTGKPHKESDINSFHDNSHKSIMNISGDREAKNSSNDEKLEELLRLFYVAVTRAKYQCYIITGNVKSKKSSALDYLLYGDSSVYNAEKGQKFSILENVCRDIRSGDIAFYLGNRLDECIKLETETKVLPDDAKYKRENLIMGDLKELEIPDEKTIEQNWKVTSFSGLAPHDDYQKLSYDFDVKDKDHIDDTEVFAPDGLQELPESNIFNFPAGANTGSCWHEIFENIDFTSGDESIKKIVDRKLSAFGLSDSPEQQTIVFDMVKNVLNTKLPGEDRFQLKDMSDIDKLPEMEFYFSISDLDLEELQKQLENYCSKFGDGLLFSKMNSDSVNGYMNGFIDLIFRHGGRYYIIDWKSNKLDGTPGGFNQKGMIAEMAKHFYFMQYLIYTAALDKFLRTRIADYSYEKDFGGIYYIFLRGADDNQESHRGIFHDRPDELTVKSLSRLLCKGPV